MKNFTLTNHAVEQFANRWLPDHAAWRAEQDLHALLSTAKKVGRTRAGDMIYASDQHPEVRMVVKDRNVCITVLPPQEEQCIDNEELTLMQEHYDDHKKQYAERAAVLQKQIQLIDRQRAELKEIYQAEMLSLQTKRNALHSEFAWYKR